jgi:hypothetical protein
MSQMQRIIFERTGGFAGIRLSTTIEMNSLPKDEVDGLQQLLDKANFFELPEFQPARPVPDEFNYTITVESDNGRHTVHTTDTTSTGELRMLVEDLSHRARQRRA